MNISSSSAMKLFDDPDIFLGLAGTEALDQLRSVTKRLYDWRVNQLMTSTDILPGSNNHDLLPELFVDNFDNEQIYQQLALLTDHSIDQHRHCIEALAARTSRELMENSSSLPLKSAGKASVNKKHVSFVGKDDADKSLSASDGSEDDTNQLKKTPTRDKFGRVNSRKKSTAKTAVMDMGIGGSADDEEESEEERELKALLDKVTGGKPDDADNDDDDEDDGLDDLGHASGDDDDDDDDNRDDDESSEDSDSSVSKLKYKLRVMNEREASKEAWAKKKSARETSVAPVARRKSAVDDRFFKLSEMEAFLDEQDLKEQRAEHRGKHASDDDSSDDDDDDYGELADDGDGTAYMYNDFFDPPDDVDISSTHHNDNSDERDDDDNIEDSAEIGIDDDDSDEGDGLVHDEEDDKDIGSGSEDDGEDDSDDQNLKQREKLAGQTKSKPDAEKSSFEKRQEKLRQKISELEDSNLKPKPWQMSGEVPAGARPENSLLQENVDFEFMTRQAPVITETTTQKLEDLILQRIKDKAWDDVERKARPTDKMVTYSKRVVLDQEKNKMSLSQIYEQQFLKLSQKADGEGSEETVDPKQAEIKKMMQSLFVKLDALANFHYTPKPVVQDVKIISNVPALSLEEVIPSAVSDAALLAPEEVESKNHREFVGQSELTAVDRHRARRLKKRHQKAKKLRREKIEKLKEAKGLKPTTSDGGGGMKRIGAAGTTDGGTVDKVMKRIKHGRMKDMMEEVSGGVGGKMEKRKKRKLGIAQSPKPKKSKSSR